MTDINEIISGIESLAPVPPIATRILTLAEDPDSCVHRIADLIRNDPSITASILKVCNSAYFGLVQKVESVHEALTLLGLDKVIELVILDCLSSSLNSAQPGYGLGEGVLWRHAVTSAHVSVSLAGKLGRGFNKHLMYTAALLKDIGKLVLSRYVVSELEQIHTLVDMHAYSFNEAEKSVIGLSHEELGATIAERWAFSDRMVSIIRNHHLLFDADAADFETQVVHLSDLICLMMGVGTGADGLAYRFYNQVLEKTGVSEQILEDVMLEAVDLQAKIDELISLV